MKKILIALSALSLLTAAACSNSTQPVSTTNTVVSADGNMTETTTNYSDGTQK